MESKFQLKDSLSVTSLCFLVNKLILSQIINEASYVYTTFVNIRFRMNMLSLDRLVLR